MQSISLGQPKTAKAEFTFAGQPARVDDVPVWGSSDNSILTVTPAADGMTATITPVAVGEAKITLTARAGAVVAPPLDVRVELPLADTAAIVLV